ncbi:MAG: aromatic amino acid transport family protein [Waddliaceae bacterium]
MTTEIFINTKARSLWSGMLLIATTCIGAGMIALPSMTGLAGFLPAFVVTTLCWLMMSATGLLFLEAVLWLPDGSNLLSLSEAFLGKKARYLAGFLFIFLYTCLLVAYISGGAPLFSSIIGVQPTLGYFLFTALFGGIVWLGSKAVDRINWILVVGLVATFVVLIFLGSQEVQSQFLERQNWSWGLLALPILFSAFGFHNVIPSVAKYLKGDARKLRTAVILGALIPYIFYLSWQWVVIGMVSEERLIYSQESGVPVTQLLESITGNPLILSVSAFFGFFAMVTSLLGVSLSMVDFYADGFKNTNRGLLTFLVFIPPLFFTLNQPGLFVTALGYAGGFGEVILNCLFPIAMVWVGRYQMGLPSKVALFGGKPLLILLILFSFFIMGLEGYILLQSH